MYSINSLTSGSTSSSSSSKAVGGMATGLDTAEIIKGMTASTRLKIARQKQNKQLVSWQTDSFRGVSNKLIDFSKKFTSFTSSTNLLSSSFYTKTDIATSGVNADKVKVSGSSTITDNVSIVSATKATEGGAIVDSVNSGIVDNFTAGTAVDLSDTNLTALAGKTIKFTLNSTSREITFSEADMTALKTKAVGSERNTAFTTLLQEKLNTSFGKGSVTVGYGTAPDDTKLKFTTANVGSTFKVATITAEGTTALGLTAGESNRLNLNKKLSDLGIADPTTLNIGGTNVAAALTQDSTVADLLKAVNDNTATTGVSVSYIESLDKFEFKTTKDTDVTITGNVSTALFGGDVSVVKRQDAKLTVKYGDGPNIDLTSHNNSFNIDGLSINVNETFAAGTGDIKLSAKTDTDKVYNAIKDMVKDYNDIVDLVNKEYSTKPNRNYPPLTDEQRKELSESEIKAWEEKAKTGMLFGSSEMSSLSSDLRNVFFSTKENMAALNEIGITSSANWKDNGKIIINEEKLKKAIETDPDNVKALFSNPLENKKDSGGSEILVNGSPVPDATTGGVMARLKFVTDKYAKTEGSTKGILIEKAGNTAAPLSIIKNQLLDKMDSFDKMIANLNRTLATEEKRYQKQFTALEKAYSKLNAQSGWLSQQMGG